MAKITFFVPEMHCVNCSNTIKLALESQRGVINISIDLNSKNVDINYDEMLINSDKLKSLIEDKGFDIK